MEGCGPGLPAGRAGGADGGAGFRHEDGGVEARGDDDARPWGSLSDRTQEREQRELVQLRHVETICSPLSGPDVSALAHVGYFAELIDEWSLEGDPNEALFRLGSSVVEAIAAEVPIIELARYFEYWLLRLQGVYPAITDCARCGLELHDEALVIPTVGRVTCRQCETPDNGVVLSAFSLSFLRQARTVPPESLGSIELSDSANRQLSELHRRMFKVHLHKDLKSERVIRELTRRP